MFVQFKLGETLWPTMLFVMEKAPLLKSDHKTHQAAITRLKQTADHVEVRASY